MNTRRLVVYITFLAVFAMAARVSVDTDTWWHLRAGEWMVENQAILQVDLFSYTRYGQPWNYPAWLVQIPMYWIYSTLGPGGLNIWTALMVTLAFGFVWKAMRGGVFLRAFVLILAVTVSGVYWAARPYLATFFLAAVFLWILEMFRWQGDASSGRRLRWLPILMLVWANSHPGFAVGFLLWGVYLSGALVHWVMDWLRVRLSAGAIPDRRFGQNIIRLSSIGLLMLVAACFNPAGPAILLYPFQTVGIKSLQDFIQEWQSPNFHQLHVQPFAWLLFVLLGVVGASRRRLALTDFLLTAGFAYMGLLASRNVALFALVAPPVITRHAESLFQNLAKILPFKSFSQAEARKPQTVLNVLLLGLLALAVLVKVSLIYPGAVHEAHFSETLPVAAVAAIQDKMPPGRLFNSYNYGGYLVWALPEYPVFVDGRTDLYNDELLNQWFQVIRAEHGWEEILEKWDVRLVLVEPDTPLVDKLIDRGWSALYEDKLAVVYTK